MNNKILMVLCVFVVVLFLTGCSQQAASSGTQTNTNSNSVSASNTDINTNNNVNTNSAVNTSSTFTTSSTTGAVKDITIEASNFEFIQTGPQINKGDKVRLTFTVTSGTHSLVLSGYNIEFTPMGPGGTQSAIFVADKSGTFEYHCNNFCGSGHRDMVGKLVVN